MFYLLSTSDFLNVEAFEKSRFYLGELVEGRETWLEEDWRLEMERGSRGRDVRGWDEESEIRESEGVEDCWSWGMIGMLANSLV